MKIPAQPSSFAANLQIHFLSQMVIFIYFCIDDCKE